MAALSFIDMGKQDCTDNEAGLVVNFERIDMGFMLLWLPVYWQGAGGAGGSS